MMVEITTKTGETLKGYWNEKNYAGTVYINKTICEDRELNKNNINWSKSIKLNYNDITIKPLTASKKVAVNKPCPKCGTYCYGDCGK